MSGGVPIPCPGGGDDPSHVWGGYPIPGPGGVPHPMSGGYPIPGAGGGGTLGTPPGQTWDGVPPPPWPNLGWGTPPT